MCWQISCLQNLDAHRSLKPPILSALGDMALALGPNFSRYLSIVLQVLEQAAGMQAEKDNYDMIDYCNELRDGCLEAYTGIIQGLKPSDFGSSILRDLCGTFGAALAALVDPSFQSLITEGKRSRVKRTKTMAYWAAKELKQVQQR